MSLTFYYEPFTNEVPMKIFNDFLKRTYNVITTSFRTRLKSECTKRSVSIYGRFRRQLCLTEHSRRHIYMATTATE